MPIGRAYLLILFGLWLMGCRQQEAPFPDSPVPEVAVVEIEARDVPVPIEFVGQVLGAKDIAIRARVEGILEEIHFQEGSEVSQGDLLYVIESQPYEAEVAAMLSRVAEAKTMQVKSQNDLNRIKPLAQRKAVSQSDLDAAIASQEAALSAVQAAQANLRAAEIQLGYTKIYSPISGIIGKSQAQVGDFVGRAQNTAVLNVVSQIDTVKVEFFLTENQYLLFARRHIAAGEASRTESPPPEARLQLILADESVFPHPGRVEFIDRQVDPATGTILVQASFPNPGQLLRPGQFAKVRTIAEVIPAGILVPQRSISELQGLYRVYVVTDQQKIEEREVRPGPAIGSFRLIREGLKSGERVVYEGLQKVTGGMQVKATLAAVQPPALEEL